MSKTVVFDIEGNNFLYQIDKIHCIATYCYETGEYNLFGPKDLEAGLKYLQDATLLIGHNIAGFDLPALEKVLGFKYTGEYFDTLLASCLLWPEEFRSLEKWAQILKLKQQKVQHEDWTVYSEDMGRRCLGDIKINKDTFDYIIKNPHIRMIKEPLLLEQEVARIHGSQVIHGVDFGINKAISLVDELDEKLKDISDRILATAPWRCELVAVAKGKQASEKARRANIVRSGTGNIPFTKAFKADGKYNEVTKNYFTNLGQDYRKVKGPYTKVEFKPLNLNAPDEVKALLLSLGWRPTERNMVKDKVTGEWRQTSYKLTEDSYASLPPGLGQDIATYNMLKHRRAFLCSADGTGGAIPTARSYGTGRVPAEAFTCGTPTSRYRHNGTVCNIPRITTPYGKEIRALFGVSPSTWQVGVDLSGIEARMLAHYLLRGNYRDARKTADLILSPDKDNDFHSYNAKVWGVDRDTAKTCLYALMYGAGAKKLAAILGRSENAGGKIKQEFYKAHPAIKELIDDLERAYETRGFIIGLDGRPLYIRSNHKLLNSLLQNAAAIIFKAWMVRCDEIRRAEGVTIGIHQIIAYHDELQFEVMTYHLATWWSKIVCEAATEIGKEFKILVPIEAEAKIGHNWADCH